MRYLMIILSLLAFRSLAQTTAPEKPVLPTVDEKSTLKERFFVMKSKSQTYGEYKVIKEVVLDGVWKITQDSARAVRTLLNEAKASIASLQNELKEVQVAMKEKEASVAGIEYDSTHISVLGIHAEKKFFIGLVSIIILGLILFVGALSAKLKSMYSVVQEKSELVDSTTAEFEEYKRKSLEKQTKLSRELQNERNKLTEIKRS